MMRKTTDRIKVVFKEIREIKGLRILSIFVTLTTLLLNGCYEGFYEKPNVNEYYQTGDVTLEASVIQAKIDWKVWENAQQKN